jgi:hypothetical protein
MLDHCGFCRGLGPKSLTIAYAGTPSILATSLDCKFDRFFMHACKCAMHRWFSREFDFLVMRHCIRPALLNVLQATKTVSSCRIVR